MNNQEAKFLLSSYRPNGRDAGDPQFAGALALAAADPALCTWFAREQEFDGVVAARLDAVVPPAGLRAAILTGARVSTPPARSTPKPWWLLAAAAVVVLMAVALRFESLRPADLPMHELAALAIDDLALAHGEHEAHPAAFAALQTRLADVREPLSAALHLDLADLQRKGCRALRVGDREIFEICFKRGGAWFHAYIARRTDFPEAGADPREAITARGRFAATVWSDADNVYSLVTGAGSEALRRVL